MLEPVENAIKHARGFDRLNRRALTFPFLFSTKKFVFRLTFFRKNIRIFLTSSVERLLL